MESLKKSGGRMERSRLRRFKMGRGKNSRSGGDAAVGRNARAGRPPAGRTLSTQRFCCRKENRACDGFVLRPRPVRTFLERQKSWRCRSRSEEHTSELQSL